MPNLVVTETVENNLRALQKTLECSTAVLVQGEIGCGKSLLVMHLAELKGAKENMIQLNVDDTFDSKDLLGKYTATETPGAFEWVPGPLTLAVERGYWILMEDIDLASFDVFSVILSLLENSTLFISDKNLTITAHKDFKLIATQQLFTSGNALLTKKSTAVPYAELWGTVIMESLPSSEICAIIAAMHANFPQSIAENLADLRVNTMGTPLVSLRTLLKWAARVAKLLNNSVQFSKNNSGGTAGAGEFLSSTVREIALKEAYDCFVAKFAPGNEHDSTLLLIASACGVPDAVAEPLVLENKPIQTVNSNSFSIGRVNLPFLSVVNGLSRDSRVAFAPTRLAMSLLERLGAAVDSREHVLLSGETGVGKTFIVQYLADQLGQTLIVHNLNQQTDTSDFMGGWKPVDVMITVRELYNDFIALFSDCFNAEKNVDFLHSLQQSMSARKWERVTKQMLKGCNTFRVKQATTEFPQEVVDRWTEEEKKLQDTLEIIDQTKANVAFRFEEGSLVKAWREGHWILLDELNLATNEVLERVSSVLGDVDRLFLSDRGTSEPIHRHKNFHVFANMNPPTDVGKKDLPPSLRSRFTEFYVSEPFNRNDVSIVVKEYIGFLTHDPKIEEITQFFLDCVEKAKTVLCSLDGETKPPSFSLRTLTRALSYVRKAAPLYGFLTALYDGLLLGFATPLQRRFHSIVEQLIVKNIFKNKKPPSPTLPKQPTDHCISYEHIWVPAGEQDPFNDPAFILTESVKGHVTNLARAVFANRPVLLEGPTSSGKSSMVKYLAELTGNTFVRINNHDSTEVQEYLGHYVTDETGKLRFVDGILVTAVRNGHWVVLGRTEPGAQRCAGGTESTLG
ncbi:hypothetical protein STCU_04068 [Strigomonas culicis]|uniref:Midasin n=1 Tax=Strigomonas culicis TaxID=28005 RepID=S9UNV5_9TRYP|nr:hypothetical protein STCU_04068 [Strigomonas culicis]|eukprot:EPY30434.1 hypothetical protein STCU_04068 [Strigomonas culicis]